VCVYIGKFFRPICFFFSVLKMSKYTDVFEEGSQTFLLSEFEVIIPHVLLIA